MTDASIAQPERASPSEHPTQATVERLLQVNRDFYAVISKQFDQTRGSIAEGMTRAVEWLYPLQGQGPRAKGEVSQGEEQGANGGHSLAPWPLALRVLDAGCGNGRFARALAGHLPVVEYVGLDADAGLLSAARRHVEDEVRVNATFLEADLTADLPPLPFETFDLVASLAVLHHMPSQKLRQSIVKRLAALVAPDGYLLLSTWQFLDSERLAARQQPWAEVGLSVADVEAGDALLPWDQGVHALRYVHLIDEAEIVALATGAGMQVIYTFRADGKTGNLSLYVILRHAP